MQWATLAILEARIVMPFTPRPGKGGGRSILGESSGGPEMFCILRSEKLNESLQEKKNYIPFPMASAYEKGEGNEYLWASSMLLEYKLTFDLILTSTL